MHHNKSGQAIENEKIEKFNNIAQHRYGDKANTKTDEEELAEAIATDKMAMKILYENL